MLTEDEREKFLKAGKIAGLARDHGAELVREGVSYLEVAEAIEGFIRDKGGIPAFPTNIAVNDVAAHYTPTYDDEFLFRSGDLVKIDVGVHVDGYIGDTARTVEVDTHDYGHIIRASQDALSVAIDMVRPGVKMRDVGGAIERAINAYNLTPIENLTGHSIERFNLHTGLSVPNVMDYSDSVVAGECVLAVEPFATNGKGRVDGKVSGNIFRLNHKRNVKQKELFEFANSLETKFGTLPFAERWCYPFEKKSRQYLRKLTRMGAIITYPILVEVEGGFVSQAEHTLIVGADGTIPTTQV